MDKKLIEEFKINLEKEKEALVKELESFAKKDTKPSGDWDTKYPQFNGDNLEEEADEVAEYERLLPVEHSLESKLKDVNLALGKIKEGKYGICENCKKEIDIERLKIMPEARICLNCQK